ncbi:MAG: hypothetical protein ACYTF6_05855 [Planctomycetota bacterium]
MRKRKVVLAVIVAAGAACLAARRDADKGAVPTFRSEGYLLACTELKARSDIDLAERGEKEHTVALEGTISVPQGEDVVAVGEALKVLRAIDDENIDLVKNHGASSRSASRHRKESYRPVREGKAEVEVKKLDLTANAYKIESMTVQASAIVAREREQARLPAVVMETKKQLHPGLAIRIERLRITTDRDFNAVIRYERSAAGTAGPFIEQVWVLDEEGMKLGGGKWTSGDPFDKSGSVTVKFKLAGKSPHKYVRIVAVTECETRTVTFEIEDIFQQ